MQAFHEITRTCSNLAITLFIHTQGLHTKEDVCRYHGKSKALYPSCWWHGPSVKNSKTKLSSPYNKHPCTITQIKGSMITARNAAGNHVITHNCLQFKQVHLSIHHPNTQDDGLVDEMTAPIVVPIPQCPAKRRYPTSENRSTSRASENWISSLIFCKYTIDFLNTTSDWLAYYDNCYLSIPFSDRSTPIQNKGGM